MIFLILAIICLARISVSGQSSYDVQAISDLQGCEVEDIDSDEFDRLYHLLKRPLKLNLSSSSDLIASGLFNRYQAASLIDYRERNGDILSYMELSSIDGFPDAFVRKIRPFISLDIASNQMRYSSENEILLRAVLKTSDSTPKYSYDTRYTVEGSKCIRAAVGLSNSAEAATPKPDIISGNLEWNSLKFPIKLVLGDLNARFGQGLSLWNGLDMNSYNTPASYMRRPSGITSSNSLTGKYAYTGFGSEISIKNWTLTALLASPGIKNAQKNPEKIQLLPAANLSYLWRNGQAGLTHSLIFSNLTDTPHIPCMNTSADFMLCVKGVDLFTEVAFDWVEKNISAVSGVVFPICEYTDAAVKVRMLPDEYILNCSSSLVAGKWININGSNNSERRMKGSASTELIFYPISKADTQRHSIQMKFHTQWQYAFNESLTMIVRLTERIRSWGLKYRTDIRSDIQYSSHRFSSCWRINLLNCKGTSFLTYLDEGLNTSKIGIHLRQGLFLIDNWDDRIYAYEHDVPGSFHSPAYYGRGFWLSAMHTWRITQKWKLHIRAGYTAYPFMKEKKPGKAELKLQTIFRF